MTERSLRAVLMRGGTSKGVFVHLGDLPTEPAARDSVIRSLLGSPDPMQIDGLGGTHSSTSKLVAVGPSTVSGCDVDYLFAQVAVATPDVDLAGNCGNLTTAVGPFAVDEGLVAATEPASTVTMRNLNTGVVIRATVPTRDGRAAVEGDHVDAGVPGTGAPIALSYLDPAGSVLSGALPSGRPVDTLTVDGVGPIDISIVDVTSPHAFVAAEALGVCIDIAPADANRDGELLARLEAVRSAAGASVGLESLAVPRLVLVAPGRDGCDVVVRATSMQAMHHAVPMTGALCASAAARIEDTVVHRLATPSDGPIRIRHPKGVVEIGADVRVGGDGVDVRSVDVVRTARRLMTGEAHIVVTP